MLRVWRMLQSLIEQLEGVPTFPYNQEYQIPNPHNLKRKTQQHLALDKKGVFTHMLAQNYLRNVTS